MEINTQEEFWIEVSKCNMDKDKILSLLMKVVSSMLPTEKQLEERTKGWEKIRKKSKEIDKAIKERRNKFPQIFDK